MSHPCFLIRKNLPVMFMPHGSASYVEIEPVIGMRELMDVETPFSLAHNDNNRQYGNLARRFSRDNMMGISMRFADEQPEGAFTDKWVDIELVFRTEGDSMILQSRVDLNDAVACWRSWGDMMGLPLLLVDDQDNVHQIVGKLGPVIQKKAKPRRSRPLRGRRPRYSARRLSDKRLKAQKSEPLNFDISK
jgi:hypothetical protein